MSELVDADAVARHLHVTRATILSWGRRGLIPRVLAGRRRVRFNLVEVEAALKQDATPREELRHAS
jgi:predicted site-specific integrase-resolvase